MFVSQMRKPKALCDDASGKCEAGFEIRVCLGQTPTFPPAPLPPDACDLGWGRRLAATLCGWLRPFAPAVAFVPNKLTDRQAVYEAASLVTLLVAVTITLCFHLFSHLLRVFL